MAERCRVIIAGGGTGGHIFPAIAIARALERKAPGAELLFVGALGKMEMEKVPAAGYRIEGLHIAAMDRSAWWKNLSLPLKLVASIMQSRRILRDFRPQVVVGVGGFASFPVLYAAQRAGIPTLIQEQNSYAGKANQRLGKRASVICVAYEGMERFFPRDRIVFTGNPVRSQVVDSTLDRAEALRQWELDPGRPTLLAFGGSLGARSINESVAAALEDLKGQQVQLIWQTGKPFHAQALAAAAGKEHWVKVREFIPAMETAYAAADVVICRAGAMSIAELSVQGKAVVFVPYPYAAEDHQTMNAMALVRRDAALLVPDAEARPKLIREALALLGDTGRRKTLAENIRKTGIRDADDRIANQILQLTA